MAIIRSMGVGAAKKSMGNVTYRTIRGRTIGSQKVGDRPLTRAEDVSLQQFVFGLVNRYMTLHAADINVSFNKTKYGSQRNYFAKINFPELKEAFSSLYGAGQVSVDSISDAQIEAAVLAYVEENPTAIYRVRLSGAPIVYLTGAWSSADNPVIIKDMPVFEALQQADGTAYRGSTSECYIAGQNLDKITDVIFQVKENSTDLRDVTDLAWQLQADGRLKLTYTYNLEDPLDGGIVGALATGTPTGSINWSV